MDSPRGVKRSAEDSAGDTADQQPAKRASTGERAEAVMRLIVPSRKVGSIIGKAGAIVKQIREDTNTRIRVVEAMPNSDDRVIVISGIEDLSVEFHGSQEALQQVYMKVVEGEEGTVATPIGQGPGHVARMLVCHTQAGSVIGKQGKIIKEIREASGAFIKVLPPEDLPPCALANDRVIHMTGTVDALQAALKLVSKQIRDNPPKERPEPLPAASALAANGVAGGQVLQGSSGMGRGSGGSFARPPLAGRGSQGSFGSGGQIVYG
ncbi:hypothetical protein WJX73_000618 [Symbiochloris irregularis]|uniref:K Homology domain-containing protein n=1 Tax=Symbiochloris irregularis TaxID=706552 RepID=A0AAW1PU18_9CHLO